MIAEGVVALFAHRPTAGGIGELVSVKDALGELRGRKRGGHSRGGAATADLRGGAAETGGRVHGRHIRIADQAIGHIFEEAVRASPQDAGALGHRRVGVAHPLPDVPGHIKDVKPTAIGAEAPHRISVSLRELNRVFVIAPGIKIAFRPSGRYLPFGFSRQALFDPLAISGRLIPRHALNGMLVLTRRESTSGPAGGRLLAGLGHKLGVLGIGDFVLIHPESCEFHLLEQGMCVVQFIHADQVNAFGNISHRLGCREGRPVAQEAGQGEASNEKDDQHHRAQPDEQRDGRAFFDPRAGRRCNGGLRLLGDRGLGLGWRLRRAYLRGAGNGGGLHHGRG